MLNRRKQRIVVALAVLGAAVQQCGIAAASGPETAIRRQASAVVGDVAIGADGNLHGQVVNRQGIGLANEVVTLQSRGQRVERVFTDKDGYFQAPANQGGVYALHVQKSTVAVRAWKQQAAPPNANRGILLIADEDVAARGQLLDGSGNLLGLGLTGAIIAVVVVEAVDNDNNSGAPPGPPGS